MTPYDDSTETRIAIIGAGFGGLGMAIRLRQSGIEDFVILERAADIGGTWRDNSYPGCACDVESHLYSFSFAPNPEWSRSFSPQAEIQDYLKRCADEFGITPHVRLEHAVLRATWDDVAQRWVVDTSRGRFVASVLVMASGALSDPVIPSLPGLDRFAGEIFHSAKWNHDYDLTGRRVAVIGTGASAIQFVPRIQPVVGALHLFQRTPPWILPQHNRRYGDRTRRLLRRFPLMRRLLRARIYAQHELYLLGFRGRVVPALVERAARRHLRRAVPDPALRAKLTPAYRIGCKRVLLSNDYLPALTHSNVELVTSGIGEIRERSIVDREGVERPVDAIIFGTGFQPTDPLLSPCIRGRDGVTLAASWGGSPKAYLGTTVAGFPNLFVLMGPNTGLGHTSVVYMIEAQIEHVLSVLAHMRGHGAAAIEPRPEAQAAFVADVQRRMRGMVWVAGGCASWYLDATGRNSTLWPDFTWRFRRSATRLIAADYVLHAPRSAVARAMATS